MIDGKLVFKGSLGGAEDLRLANVKGTDGWQQILDRFQKIPVKLLAGQHEIIAGFIDRSHVQSDDNVGGGGGRAAAAGGAPDVAPSGAASMSWRSKVPTSRPASRTAPAGR